MTLQTHEEIRGNICLIAVVSIAGTLDFTSKGEVRVVVMAPEREPIVADGVDIERFTELERILSATAARPRVAQLIGPTGEQIALPQALYAVLLRAVHVLAAGNGLSILPVEATLTTQQAADILSVSRPHLIKMLESGDMPFRMVGTHRRIKLQDVLVHQRRQDEETERGLANMARLAQETGTYNLLPEEVE